jgi:epsilon-lactone hydrolase
MASDQAVQFADFLGGIRERASRPDLDLSTIRDVLETMHLASREPEGVSYAEVNTGGVEALWCIPTDSDPDAVLLHSHMGGTVVTSMHSDRKAAAHIACATGVRSLVLNYRRAPEHKFPAQTDDVDTAHRWLLDQGYEPAKIASVGHSVGGNFAISLALRLRDKGAPLPGAILSISPWVDLSITNETITSNAESDKLLSRPLLEFFRSAWLDGTGVGWDDPRVNLLAADLAGLPPIAVYSAQTSCSRANPSNWRSARRRRETKFSSVPCPPVNTPSSSAQGGYLKSMKRSQRWAPGCGRS